MSAHYVAIEENKNKHDTWAVEKYGDVDLILNFIIFLKKENQCVLAAIGGCESWNCCGSIFDTDGNFLFPYWWSAGYKS